MQIAFVVGFMSVLTVITVVAFYFPTEINSILVARFISDCKQSILQNYSLFFQQSISTFTVSFSMLLNCIDVV